MFGVAIITQLPVNSSGLVDSQTCGSWSLRDDAGDGATDLYDLDQAQKERRAAQYARDCYAGQRSDGPDLCEFFAHPRIPYEIVESKEHCPFADVDFCDKPYGAIKFSTGRISSSIIGINSLNPPKFRRTTVCTPLNVKGNPQHFVRRVAGDGTPGSAPYVYEYDLGQTRSSVSDGNYTFRTMGDAFGWDIPGYSVR
jgi:hypothetical protein